jgi:hypothetical protein
MCAIAIIALVVRIENIPIVATELNAEDRLAARRLDGLLD